MTLYSQMPFPPHQGLPWMSDPPTIDGFMEPDPGISTTQLDAGYTAGGRFAFGGASGVPMAVFQGVKHNAQDLIYMGFVARYDQSFDDDDFVMIVLQPSPGAPSAADRRIDVHPVHTGAGANAAPVDSHDSGPSPLIRTNKDPRALTVYERTPGGAHKWQAIGTPAGLLCKVRSTEDGSNRFWSVELVIPTTGWMTLQPTFGLYFNIGQVYLAPYEMVNQYPWPFDPANPAANILMDPVDGTVDPRDWDPPQYGNGLLNNTSAAQGVKFLNDAYGIGVFDGGGNITGSADLGTGATNRFVARLQNTSPNTAPKVRARFRIAEFGISGGLYGNSAAWADLPTPANTNPAPHAGVDIPTTPGASYQDIELDWTITSGDHATFSTLGPDQCLWVQLDTIGGGAAEFVEDSVRRNLWLTNLSNITHRAVLDAKHLDIANVVRDNHELLLQVAPSRVQVVAQTPLERSFKEGGVQFKAFHPFEKDAVVQPIAARVEETAPVVHENPILSNVVSRSPIVRGLRPVPVAKLATWFTAVNAYHAVGGRTLTFAGGKKRRIVVYSGSYGYIAQHALKFGESIDKLQLRHDLVAGPNVKPIGNNFYSVIVSPEAKVTLVNRLATVPVGIVPKAVGVLVKPVTVFTRAIGGVFAKRTPA